MSLQHTLRYTILSILFSCFFTTISKDFGKTFFNHRSQCSNSAYRITGPDYLPHIVVCQHNYNQFFTTVEYNQTFDTIGIAEFLFFNDTSRLRFGNAGGTDVDVFSRNFFLNDDFTGTANILPSIKNFITHFDLYFDLSCITKGLYVATHIPFVWTLWNLDLHETKPKASTIGTFIPANALGNPFPRSSPVKSIVDAWKGTTINVNSNPTKPKQDFFPALKQPMHFATINGPRARAGVPDIEFFLGYSVPTDRTTNFDIQARLILPTGNAPQAEFFFEPIAGNGKHTELGIAIVGHDTLEYDERTSKSWYIDAGIYHMFPTSQRRTFDLINNGPGSRYLLFKKFDGQGNYANEVLFGPNVTTLSCKVRSDYKVDASLMVQWTWHYFSLDLGYNVFARSKEKIELTSSIAPQTFGIQGKTQTAGASVNTTASRTTINGSNAEIFDPTAVYITTADINIRSAAHPLTVSHKLFVHCGYGWTHNYYTPFIGLGIQAEVSAISNTAAQQIGFWAQGGLTF